MKITINNFSLQQNKNKKESRNTKTFRHISMPIDEITISSKISNTQPAFGGLFNWSFFKNKKQEESPVVKEKIQTEQVNSTIQPENTPENGPLSLEDIVGPYIEPSPQELKRLHNEITNRMLLKQDSITFDQVKQNVMMDFLTSPDFDMNLQINLYNDDNEKSTIYEQFKRGKYDETPYMPILLLEFFGKDDKPLDEKLTVKNKHLREIDELMNDESDKYFKKGINFYSKIMDLKTPEQLIISGLERNSADLLEALKKGGVDGSVLLSLDKKNPDLKTSFAEAAVLSFDKKINKIFSLAKTWNESALSEEGNSANFKLIQKKIQNLPIEEFIKVIKESQKLYDTSAYTVEIFDCLLDRFDKDINEEAENRIYISEKRPKQVSEYYKEVAALLDNMFYKPCDKISEEETVAVNNWLLSRFMTKVSPKNHYGYQYFVKQIIDNPYINVLCEDKQSHESLLDRALKSEYSKEYCETIIDKAACQNIENFTEKLKKLPDEEVNKYNMSYIDRLFSTKLKDNIIDKEKNDILDYYKLLYSTGTQSDLSYVENNYEYAKLLLDAGINIDKEDSNRKTFINLTQFLRDKEENKLLPDKTVIEHLEYYAHVSEYVVRELLRLSSNPVRMQERYVELYNALKEMDIANFMVMSNLKQAYKQHYKYFANNVNYNENNFVHDTKVALHDAFVAKLKKRPNEYDARIFFADTAYSNISDEKQARDLLKEIIPIGVANFSFRIDILNDALKLGLKHFFEKNPELKDNIYTMKDFMKLFNSKDIWKIKSLNVPINENNETLLDVFINIDPQEYDDIQEQTNVIKYLNDYDFNCIKWDYADKYGSNYALKAVEAENIPMIKLLLEKKADFTQRNKFGTCAVEAALNSPNSAIREMFADIKVNSPEFVKLAQMGSVSGMEMLLKKGYIDINSKYGDYTAWLASAVYGKANAAEFLMTQPDVDFNAVDSSNNKFAALAVQNKSEEIITNIFPKLTSEQLDINYINNNTTIYENVVRYLSPEMFRDVLDLKSADPNIETDKKDPIAFQLIFKGDLERFKIACESGKLDLTQTISFNKYNLQDYINHLLQDKQKKQFLEALAIAVDKKIVNDVKKIVEENGVLSLKNINEFLDYPKAKNIVSSTLSDTNERIGHLLLDNEINPENMFDILNLAEKIHKLDPNAFTYRDKFGTSAIDKALLAENNILFEFMTQNSSLTDYDITKLKQIAQEMKISKITQMVDKLKSLRRSNDKR